MGPGLPFVALQSLVVNSVAQALTIAHGWDQESSAKMGAVLGGLMMLQESDESGAVLGLDHLDVDQNMKPRGAGRNSQRGCNHPEKVKQGPMVVNLTLSDAINYNTATN